MEVGNVNCKHFVLALKVKSVLDPCGDENDDIQDDEDWMNNRHLDTVELADVPSNFPDISVKSEYAFMVKEEMDGQLQIAQKSPKVEDHMHMKALYHALLMKYVSVAKLQNKLDGQANQTVVRRLINRMTRDGFLEAKGNRRLEKELLEVKRALNNDPMDMDTYEPHNKTNNPEMRTTGSNHRDMSTCGVLHSIGSDLTRMRGHQE
ncbi:hypothetical protein REPUB_Repub01dG0070800 [Reevesia pubescens]